MSEQRTDAVLDDLEWVRASQHPKVIEWRRLAVEHVDVSAALTRARSDEAAAERAWTAASHQLEAVRAERVRLETKDAELRAAIDGIVKGD